MGKKDLEKSLIAVDFTNQYTYIGIKKEIMVNEITISDWIMVFTPHLVKKDKEKDFEYEERACRLYEKTENKNLGKTTISKSNAIIHYL